MISGLAKGRKLKMVPGATTRPITDRVKENLFNILADSVIDTRWLDLFAGTGQVGIEALSRGAQEVVFVDQSPSAIRTIRENLRITQLGSNARVLRRDAFAWLEGRTAEQFDVIYVAPPQYKELWSKTVFLVDSNPEAFLDRAGMVIVQIDPKEFVELPLQHLQLQDQRRYGRTALCFYELGDSRFS